MSSSGYAAAFVAQKSARGAYGRENKSHVAYTKELSAENYASLTAERLQREKERKQNLHQIKPSDQGPGSRIQ